MQLQSSFKGTNELRRSGGEGWEPTTVVGGGLAPLSKDCVRFGFAKACFLPKGYVVRHSLSFAYASVCFKQCGATLALGLLRVRDAKPKGCFLPKGCLFVFCQRHSLWQSLWQTLWHTPMALPNQKASTDAVIKR
jgi:hypothetical protein